MEKVKIRRCRYAHPSFLNDYTNPEFHCVADGWKDDKVKVCTEEMCEACEKFDSRYIEYPLTIEGIESETIDTTGIGHECGCLVEIKPCGEEYADKSYLGIYIGDLPIQITSSFDPTTKVLKNSTMNNPAIFVPELRKIVYGCESWWREIKSLEDFKGISEEEIENTWYVQLLKAMGEC